MERPFRSFIISRSGRTLYGAVVGFGAGFGTAEIARAISNIEVAETTSPYIVGSIGAIAIGSAFFKDKYFKPRSSDELTQNTEE
jgi:hypothetical protein